MEWVSILNKVDQFFLTKTKYSFYKGHMKRIFHLYLFHMQVPDYCIPEFIYVCIYIDVSTYTFR